MPEFPRPTAMPLSPRPPVMLLRPLPLLRFEFLIDLAGFMDLLLALRDDLDPPMPLELSMLPDPIMEEPIMSEFMLFIPIPPMPSPEPMVLSRPISEPIMLFLPIPFMPPMPSPRAEETMSVSRPDPMPLMPLSNLDGLEALWSISLTLALFLMGLGVRALAWHF